MLGYDNGNEMRTYLLLSSLLIILLPSVSVGQQHDIRDIRNICGSPPEFSGRLEESEKIRGDLEGKAQFLSRFVGDAGLYGKVETERRAIYQSADKISAAQQDAYFTYMLCVIIMDDHTLSTPEKIKAIKEFRKPLPDLRGGRDDHLPIGPTRISYKANFGNWLVRQDEHGFVGGICPTASFCQPQLRQYLLRSHGNTWATGGPLEFQPVTGNFQMDLEFKMPLEKECALDITLSDLYHSSLIFVFEEQVETHPADKRGWQSTRHKFSIYEDWFESGYVTKSKRIAERSPAPVDRSLRSPIVLWIRRVGGEVEFNIADHTLQRFEAPVFNVNNISVASAFGCDVILTSVEILEPV